MWHGDASEKVHMHKTIQESSKFRRARAELCSHDTELKKMGRNCLLSGSSRTHSESKQMLSLKLNIFMLT